MSEFRLWPILRQMLTRPILLMEKPDIHMHNRVWTTHYQYWFQGWLSFFKPLRYHVSCFLPEYERNLYREFVEQNLTGRVKFYIHDTRILPRDHPVFTQRGYYVDAHFSDPNDAMMFRMIV